MLYKEEPLNAHIVTYPTFYNRTLVVGMLIIVISLLLLVRMVYLQLVDHQFYTDLSHENRIDVIPTAPRRGLIYDRNGTLLADNKPVFSLEVIPAQVKNIEQTITRLREIIPISDSDYQQFKKQLKRKRKFDYITLKKSLSDEEQAIFAVQKHEYPGVDINARLVRHYPSGDAMSHVLGYVGNLNENELKTVSASNYSATKTIGKVGVEKHYEDILHGQVGFQHVEVDARRRIIKVLKETPPDPGKNLTLTIDSKLQNKAQALLTGLRGAIVAIEPKTGEILALTSNPTYNNNWFSDGIDATQLNKLQTAASRPLFNRAIRGRYPPGSTIKPFIGLLGLDANVITPNYRIRDPGYYKLDVGTRLYRDWKRFGHGHSVNLKTAIVESCDTYFYNLADMLGIDRMHAFLSGFGFGELSLIDIHGERQGILPSREWKRKHKNQVWFPGETLITGIGQGFMLITPIQLAWATTFLANQGLSVRPHLLKQINDVELASPLEKPIDTVTLKNPTHWDLMNEYMRETVHSNRGTAWKIGRDAPYTIAGKTGTSQVFSIPQGGKYDEDAIEAHLRDHALFISFAPLEDPKIAIAVVIENGGSGAATQPARDLMDYYLLDLGHLSRETQEAS